MPLTLNDIVLFFEDFFPNRAKHLQALASGASYLKLLQQRHAQLKALPEALRGKPLAEQLSSTDDLHDRFGRALFYFSKGYQELPSLAPHLLQNAKKIQEVFIPSLEKVRERYPEEALRATELRAKLDELGVELKSLSIANGTLFDVASSFVTQGETLGKLLSQRADTLNASDRSDATKVFTSTLGVISRIRAALPDERELNPDLDADIEDKLFGYLDLLSKSHTKNPTPTEPTDQPTEPQS